MTINLQEMRKLAGDDLSEAKPNLSWGDQRVYDKVKKALGKEKVPLSKLADVATRVARYKRDLFDAWDIAKHFIADKGDHFNAFKREWETARKAQKAWEKEASAKAEPAIHKHMDNAIAALKKADAEMKAAAKLAQKSRHHLLKGVSPLRDFLTKPISGLEQLKKGEALGMYYSPDW